MKTRRLAAIAFAAAVVPLVRADEPAPRAPRSVETALLELAHDDAAKRVEVLAELGKAGLDAAAGVPVLVAALEDDDERVRAAAAALLEALGELAAVPLLDFLRDDAASSGAQSAAGVIAELGQRVTPRDLAFAQRADPDGGAVLAALMPQVRGADGRAPAETVAVLREQATGPVARHRLLALAALAHLGRVASRASGASGAAAKAVPADLLRVVIERSGSERVGLRLLAAGLLVDVATGEPDEVAALTRLLDAREAATSGAAARALVRLGRTAPLLERLRSEDPARRLDAAVHLSAGPDPAADAVPVLLAVLAEGGPSDLAARLRATRALGGSGAVAEPAVARLRELVAAADRRLGVAAAVSLLRILGEDAQAEKALRAALGEGDALPGEDVLPELARLRAVPRALVPRVAELLALPAAGVRRLPLVEGLVEAGPGAAPAVPALLQVLREAQMRLAQAAVPGRPPRVLETYLKEGWTYGQALALPPRILDALRRIGPDAASAVGAIEPVRGSEDPLLRYHAARALRAIRPAR